MKNAIQFKDAKYTIKLNKRNIINQKIAALAECSLNGRTLIVKNKTKIKEEILRFKKILKLGMKLNKTKISIDNNPPIIRNEYIFSDFRNSSFNIGSSKVIKNMMIKEARTKLRSINRFILVKYKGHEMKLRYEIIIRDDLILSLLEAITFQKANNLKR